MTFDEVLAQVLTILQRQGRVSYGALKRRFSLDDAYLADLKAELIDAQRLAVDEAGRVLVWIGNTGTLPAPPPAPQAPAPIDGSDPSAAERRQLTVMFCDLVDSTRLASQLDPEDLREVVRAYQATCAEVVQHFDGHIAQYLGDGLLVYFGYPQAHEDDAQRAIRTGLGIVEALRMLNRRLEPEQGIRLAVRVGIHTGVVVVGAVGSGRRQEHLALGDTPNIAARIQHFATSDTVVISAATLHLVRGYFICRDLGPQPLRGVATAVPVYQILGESGVQSRLDVAVTRGLTPLVGREAEVTLLRERWAQVKGGLGQIVMLSGEAGIGKSRLVQMVKDHIAHEPHTRLECRCSPYYQHTALYPIIDFLERLLHFQSDEALGAKLEKLEHALSQYRLALHETVPLFATLLSLPLSEARYAPLHLTPQRQKQKTLEAILTIVLELAERHPVLVILEDLHWVDPTTLEFLHLLLDQGPTTRLLIVVTYRPEFQPPWGLRTHLTPLTLQRLPPVQAREMVERVAGGKPLPLEVTQQIVTQTDGVPLFIEELTKMVVESGLLREEADHYALTGPLPPLAIPTTLHDSLMARLDRLGTVKVVAQLGATIGRSFAYELLRAVSPLEEATLQHGLRQLIDTELLYQRGVPPQAIYLFKHALIQEAAYQSLVQSTRQQYHQRIAQALEGRFPDLVETQPEVLAQHYTAAGLIEPAIRYWQQAGQRAHARAAHAEAVVHLTQGLTLLATLPESPERAQQELALQLALGPPLMVTKGFAAPEVGTVYARAQELCQQIEETPELFRVLRGLFGYYEVQAEVRTARRIAEQLLHLAHRLQGPGLFVEAHRALGDVLYYLGEFPLARQHLEEGAALYTAEQHHRHALLYGQDPGVGCLTYLAATLWLLGYPDQALTHSQQALTLAQERAHPFSLMMAVSIAAGIHCYRREPQAVQERAEAALALARKHEFTHVGALGLILQGWALAAQDQTEAGIAQIRQGLAAHQATGAKLTRPFFLTLLADAYRRAGQPTEGLGVIAEALTAVQHTGVCEHAAEMYRLQGELCLQAGLQGRASGEDEVPWVAVQTCFHQALDIARRQQAKSLELRAALSLSRLWQQQGQYAAARQLLAEVYGWFTEGLETADLQEARALLEALG